VRLGSHIDQLRTFINGDEETVGKKIDFLVQEMNREANTIGSKSNDMDITSWMLELKAEIEKIREQVQNIE
jgi:yicC domain protein